jgi:hypothetical protein
MPLLIALETRELQSLDEKLDTHLTYEVYCFSQFTITPHFLSLVEEISAS